MNVQIGQAVSTEARINGIVKFATCRGATGVGGHTCEKRTCKHAPKEWVWVKWPNEKNLFSYHITELNEFKTAPKQEPTEERKQDTGKHKHTNEVEEKMDNNKQSFFEMVKDDGVNAGYRVAATQVTTGIRGAILTVLKNKGMDEGKLKAVSDLLETEIGRAMISVMLGYGLTYMPMIGEDARAQRLAKEFRVEGMATVGNEIVGTLMENFLPVITQALSALPKEEGQLRVEGKKDTKSLVESLNEEEHEEVVVEAPKARRAG